MHILITAGPTREHIDTVRFITNASSGKMGYACARAARAAGHKVTLITGPVALPAPEGCRVVRITTVEELTQALGREFPRCDALIMSAAVGDFTVRPRRRSKIPRAGGPVRITLVPTPDVLAGVSRQKRPGQTIISFAVEDRGNVAKARREMAGKRADFTVLNTPAAMAADRSLACVLSPTGLAIPWARRDKTALARAIIALLGR